MKIQLLCTCEACPEQYDAYHEGRMVGYLRLRWGSFYAEHLPSMNTVYTAEIDGPGGRFNNDNERQRHLDNACAGLIAALIRDGMAGRGGYYEMIGDPPEDAS